VLQRAGDIFRVRRVVVQEDGAGDMVELGILKYTKTHDGLIQSGGEMRRMSWRSVEFARCGPAIEADDDGLSST